MGSLALKVEGLSKEYRMGTVQQESVQEAISRAMGRLMGRKGGRSSSKAFWALKDIAFELEKGDVLGIIGRNGAGKSTLLRILSEITPPSSGKISYYGNFSSILEVGTGFHPDLTGRENVYLRGELAGVSRGEMRKRFDEIVSFSGVEEFIDTPVKHYSNGMFLRLAFSVAFHSEIDILILDEVLSVGDAEFKIKSFNKIQSMANAGATILIVSHGVNDILGFCNKCMYLEKGMMRAWGNPMDLMQDYISRTLEKVESTQEAILDPDARQPGVLQPEYGVDKFVLESVKVHASGKVPGEPVYMSDDIELAFVFVKLVRKGSMQLILSVNEMSGIPLLVDSWALRPDYDPEPMPAGRYHVSTVIPRHLLNRGTYAVNLMVAEEGLYPIAQLNNVSKFRVDLDPENKHNIWNEKIGATLRPRLQWVVEKGEDTTPVK